ncbi:MAG: 30S ribosomal protein S26e [Candidatus Thorarchaeota archaeon]
MEVAKKRKSGGRSKGSSGKSKTVQCSKCGRIVPMDKAKRHTKRVSLVDFQLARELRQQGSFIQTKQITQYYCVSCAVHTGRVQIRQASERKTVPRRRRY